MRPRPGRRWRPILVEPLQGARAAGDVRHVVVHLRRDAGAGEGDTPELADTRAKASGAGAGLLLLGLAILLSKQDRLFT